MLEPKVLLNNLASVKARITAAAERSGRSAGDVRLVVVTKGHPAQVIQALFDLGVHDIGESYVDEGTAKRQILAALDGLTWHMIGHVQSRKAEEVAHSFDLVHSVDSLKLATRLDRFAGEASRILPVLLECNVSGEASKHGWPLEDDGQLSLVLAEIEQVLQLPNVRVRGLMSMAPITDQPEQARPFFKRTRVLRDDLAKRFPAHDWSQLSMGMSDDFEAAILEEATIVRIGTAIVGPRPE